MGECCSKNHIPPQIPNNNQENNYAPAGSQILTEQEVEQYIKQINDQLLKYKNRYYRTQHRCHDIQQQCFYNDNYLKLQNGIIYQGQWNINRQMEGYGQIIIPSKAYYCGRFKEGQISGEGVIIYSNLDIYEGNFLNNSFNGKGNFYGHDGQKYQGNWLNDQRNGLGTLETQLYKYTGNFSNGDREGQGELEYFQKYKYKGEFKNNEFSKGKFEYLDGTGRVYEGQFQNNKKSGTGTFQWNFGKYEGEYENNLRNGRGTIEFIDGIKVQGQFINGSLNGQATIFLGEIQTNAIFSNSVIESDIELSQQIKDLFQFNDFDENIY